MAQSSEDSADCCPAWYRQNAGLMLHAARRYAGADAEDVVSECVMSLLRQSVKLDQMNAEEQARYILIAVRHAAVSWLRRRRREIPLSRTDPQEHSAPDHAQPENHLELSEQLQLLRQALGALPEKERLALQMKTVEGLTDREIAKLTGLSAVSVRQYVARARKKLKAQLGFNRRNDL